MIDIKFLQDYKKVTIDFYFTLVLKIAVIWLRNITGMHLSTYNFQLTDLDKTSIVGKSTLKNYQIHIFSVNQTFSAEL